MIRFSANLGLLWPELDLCSSIRAASQAGFDAVECHWPYEVPAEQVDAALTDAGIPMLAINTRRGNPGAGEFGFTAVPGRQHQARSFIDEALEYADRIQCLNIHAMAGISDGGDIARSTYIENLNYACIEAFKRGITVLIEPINNRDVPGYYLNTLDAAVETLQAVKHENLKIMFDCYHIQIMQGDIINRINSCFDHIGHMQFASVPDRAEPDTGELDYVYIVNVLEQMGYQGYLGAEYNPSGITSDHLGWLNDFKKINF